ncbi:hypothetical protein QCA50_001967 [Cerrena zonata]|uniref:Yeast cell wall synthesis Kre9/Knh1-like N-terminal domain-containing protein n=1 Tax=Cerrena zonata TaxID=2478898 RepID=A0AAW0GYC7_9APHY
MKFTTVFTCLAVALSASASPLSNSRVGSRAANIASDVWDPKVNTPTTGTVWTTGSKQNITWDTAGIPEEALDTPGVIYLGHIENDSENLDIANPIAKGFKYRDGTVEVTVPDVETRPDYIVALLGDSGNISPQFTISKDGAIPSPAENATEPVTSSVPVTSPIPVTSPVATPDTTPIEN